MEIKEYKTKKISEITLSYSNLISIERQIHARNSINIRRNFLLSQFQRQNQILSLDNQLRNTIASLQQKMNVELNNLNSIVTKTISTKGNKKALLIGINYENTVAQLNGCINDVSLIGNHIKNKGFSVTLLTDKTEKKPTKTNIITELENFLSSSLENDILYFHYSGHGSNVVDLNNDELDRKDETIVSKDLQNITDDELVSIIRKKLPKNRTLIAVFDSCHSGTVLDLKYNVEYVENSQTLRISDSSKYTDIDPNIIMISGCRDSQYSEECLTSTGVNGLLTWGLYETITKNKNLTFKSIYVSLLKLLKGIGAIQVPQLSMGSLIDINESINIF